MTPVLGCCGDSLLSPAELLALLEQDFRFYPFQQFIVRAVSGHDLGEYRCRLHSEEDEKYKENRPTQRKVFPVARQLVQGVKTRKKAMRILRNGFDDGKTLLLLRFQARHRGIIGSNLGVYIPAEFTKFFLITLELRSTFSVDWPFPSHMGSPHAFCLNKGLVT